ncbi:SAM-dependent methyltransferase [Lachnoclostridium sp. An196]|uniref:RsmB/NOP family class I SAM-dependent RNA methyltransferase n=1 Tax=Lachnoclostridium sp. An196 TaxID=1965583 RepID=UPI000B385D47|nr:RsmB/NOP family class I SAM-dependent RNA methyltransferase [Lachnoclostridium sp. An196]OUP19326.1 SAM-dependent methyltransferase [Lachnoclostridium sp. An196]
MGLPVAFIKNMREILGEEGLAEYLDSFEKPKFTGLRVNTSKISVEEFLRISPFKLRRVPWTENGFYYTEEDSPTHHPYYYAGLYYIQEPSAMAPAAVLPVERGERVLDLCAAPGGKATELGAKLNHTGLLVANDASASRTKALLKNLEVFGIPNLLVTSEMGDRLDRYFHEYFDKILIDAPCSGEGMFRKQAHMIPAWEKQGPEVFANMQREILRQAAELLKPGGTMLYSTCTFSKLENEGSIDGFLAEHPEFTLEEIPRQEGFCSGMPELVGSRFPLERCVRLFPHKIDGEGHFLALLKKAGEKIPGAPEPAGRPGRIPAELEAFLQDVSMPMELSRIVVKDTKVFLMPEGVGRCPGLRFLRSGLYLGELLKKRFEPSQAFAMALKKEEYASVIDLSAADDRVIRYLKGETLEIEDGESSRPEGWQLVCVDGYPLGWGKLIRGTLRNKYFSGWRMNA